MAKTEAPSYELTREELYRIRALKLLSNDRDYLYFALLIDYPNKLNPTIEVNSLRSQGVDDRQLLQSRGGVEEQGDCRLLVQPA